MSKNTLLSELINYISADSSGNVGINTATPSAKLEVNGYGTANSIMTYVTAKFYGSGTGGLNIGTDGTNPMIGPDVSATSLVFLKRVSGVYSEAMRIDSAGRVGIGTDSLSGTGSNLQVQQSGTPNTVAIRRGDSSNTGAARILWQAYNTSSVIQNTAIIEAGLDNSSTNGYLALSAGTPGTAHLTIKSTGNVGIGTSTVPYKLTVSGDVYSNQYRLNDTGGGYVTWEMENSARWRINYLGRFSSYGAGTLTTDASGNISASSDRSLKDIIKPIENVLENIMDFEPVYFKWNDKTDLDKENVYMSTIAQSIQKHYPDAVGKMGDGTLTVQDRAVTAILVQAIKELKAEIDLLKQQ